MQEYFSTIMNEIDNFSNKNPVKTIMLTGGRSAMKLYDKWFNTLSFDRYKNCKFYFTDERCVPKNSKDSIFSSISPKLFNNIPKNQVERIKTDTKEINTYKELKDFVSKKQKDFYSQRELLKSHLDACKHEKSIDRFNDIYKKTKNLSIELAILFIRYEKEVGFDKDLRKN